MIDPNIQTHLLSNILPKGISTSDFLVAATLFSGIFYFVSKHFRNLLNFITASVAVSATVSWNSAGIYLAEKWIADNIKYACWKYQRNNRIIYRRKSEIDRNIEFDSNEDYYTLSLSGTGTGTFLLKIPNLPLALIEIIDTTETAIKGHSNNGIENKFYIDIRITAFGLTYASSKEKLNKIYEHINNSWIEDATVKSYTSYNDYFSLCSIRSRKLDTVIIPDVQLERIKNSIASFLKEDSKKFYKESGVPHRLGIGLHGIPGTGKTSLIIALHDYFKIPIYRIILSEVSSDSELEKLLRNVRTNSFVVFEDIDCVGIPVNERKSYNKKSPNIIGTNETANFLSTLTLSGILNAIDGVCSPEGIVIFFTSNNFDKLDSALVRSGRIDLIEELKPLPPALQWKMLCQFFPELKEKNTPGTFALLPSLVACDVQDACLSGYRKFGRTKEAAQYAIDTLNNNSRRSEKRTGENYERQHS